MRFRDSSWWKMGPVRIGAEHGMKLRDSFAFPTTTSGCESVAYNVVVTHCGSPPNALALMSVQEAPDQVPST